jgi:hypothetical protein
MIIKRFKENSHIPISEIKRMQAKHADALIQPRTSDGELNPKFVERWGTKNINVSKHDVDKMAGKSQRLARILDDQRRKTGK